MRPKISSGRSIIELGTADDDAAISIQLLTVNARELDRIRIYNDSLCQMPRKRRCERERKKYFTYLCSAS